MDNINIEHTKLNYGSNLMQLIGHSILQDIHYNAQTGKPEGVFKNVIPEHEELMDLISQANFHVNYSPYPGFDFGFEINPVGDYHDSDYSAYINIPFNLGGL